MDKLSRDRFIITIISLAILGLSIESIMEGWEFWIPLLLLISIVGMWIAHLTQRLDSSASEFIYTAIAMVGLFYHGVHQTSFFDIAIVCALFMTTYSLFDKIQIIYLFLVEYFILQVIQIYFIYKAGIEAYGQMPIFRIALHIFSILFLTYFCRVSIKNRLELVKNKEIKEEDIRAYEKDMEDFLSNISHELRTPVNIVNGMVSMLLKNSRSDELDSIKYAGARLSNQIEDIKDYTEIKRGNVLLEEENYMTVSLINDVVEQFKSLNRNNRLEMIMDLDPTVPTLLNGDIKKLHKIFRHILDNAVKFSKRGGIYIRIYPMPRDYGINLMVTVKDCGVGMTRKDISLVSKGMYQANKKRNRSTGGIGLGLPIVYGFTHTMGGFVKIQSVKGKGTSVQVSIPQKVVNYDPCLNVDYTHIQNILFYTQPEKYKDPELRDYYKSMAVNLATGLKIPLYAANNIKEVKEYIDNKEISHVFTGDYEYEANRNYFKELSLSGITVAVSTSAEHAPDNSSSIIFMPKPLYGFPVVRVLNNDDMSVFLSSEKDGEKPKFSKVKALIVDDEPTNLIVATSLFKEYGMSIETAGSGLEAISKYKEGDFNVIFMDHMMPGMDGVECMKRIRSAADSMGRHPIIVALTANALSGAKEMFIKEGFEGFIAKPIDISEFERVMLKILPASLIDDKGGDQ